MKKKKYVVKYKLQRHSHSRESDIYEAENIDEAWKIAVKWVADNKHFFPDLDDLKTFLVVQHDNQSKLKLFHSCCTSDMTDKERKEKCKGFARGWLFVAMWQSPLYFDPPTGTTKHGVYTWE